MRWSYSSVSCYEQCPAKYRWRYLDKFEIAPKLVAPAKERGTALHAALERAIREPEFELPDELKYYYGFISILRGEGAVPEKVIVLEHDWTPALPWSEGWVKSILDVHLKTKSVAYNYDWKSGNIYPEHSDQRELYSLMQFCEDEELEKVIGMHVYIDKRENRTSTFTRADVPALKKKWEEKARPLFEDEIFPTNPSFSCRFCEFSKSNGGPCKF